MAKKSERVDFIFDLLLSFFDPIFNCYFVAFDVVLETMLAGINSIRNSELETNIFNILHQKGKEQQIDSLESCSMNYIKNAIKIMLVFLKG